MHSVILLRLLLLSLPELAAAGIGSHLTQLSPPLTYEKQSQQQVRRSAEYLRTHAVNTSGLICQLGGSHDDTSATSSYDIPFYYALGTKDNMGYFDLFTVQQRLFASMSSSISWCWSETAAKATQHTIDGNRKLASEKRDRVVQMARKLGIVSVSAGPSKITASTCPNTTELAVSMSKTNSTYCQIVVGNIRVLAHNTDNLDYMTATARDALENEINTQETWKTWNDISQLGFLLYIGDSLAQVYSDENEGQNETFSFDFPELSSSPSTHPSMAPSEGMIGVVVPVVAVAPAAKSSTPIPLIVGVGVPIAIALLVVALLTNNRKRRRVIATASSNMSVPNNLSAASAIQIYEMMHSDFVLVGAADPPGSFHEGLYHYLRDGTRYLSTRCEGCLETRRNSFYTDNNLGTILENEEFEEKILISADFKDLGKRAATHDVHRCSSAMCRRCMTDRCETQFIPARKRGRRKNENGAITSFLCHSSNKKDNQPFFLTAEHVEV